MTPSRPDIEELLCRYAWSHDARDFAGLAAVFTKDARYELAVRNGERHVQRGPDAIVDQIREFKSRYPEERRHVLTNFQYDEETETRAVVRSYVTVLHFGPDRVTIATAGTYRDEVVLTDGRWLIAAKSVLLEYGI